VSIYRIERLDRSHERGEFTCGKEPLDLFLRTLVSQYEKRRLGRTYVAVLPDEKKVRGYYTLASGAVAFENLPQPATRKLPRHPLPVVLLARLAVDQSAQGKGLGKLLLMDAFSRCLALAQQLGVHAVEVDAIDDEAVAFYQKYGFVSLLDNPRHLYLAMATIEDAFGENAAGLS
jgi:GNAT superfamily N-acetyltransferase